MLLRRTLPLVLPTCLAVTLLAGCTNPVNPGNPAHDEAVKLAAALQAGDLSTITFQAGDAKSTPAELYAKSVAAMGAAPQVTAGAATTGDTGDTADAVLDYTWSLPFQGTWTYSTTAHLAKETSGWVVVPDGSYLAPRAKAGDSLVLRTTQARRGNILGAHGAKLVKPRAVLRIGMDKTLPQGKKASEAKLLAHELGINVAAYLTKFKAYGPQAFVEALVLRPGDATAAIRKAMKLPGVRVLHDKLPLAPTHDFARPILGTVGDVTAEIVKQSNGYYKAGDLAGLSGLQLRYDEQLRGTPGVTVYASNGTDPARKLFAAKPQAGEPLRLNLDLRLQGVAERLLSSVKPASALVAIRPSTGAVIVAASGPGGNGLSTVTVGRYAPGSTMKVVSSLALLRAGLTPTTSVNCPTSVDVNGKVFTNYSDYPASMQGRNITLGQALAQSCNTAFISLRGRITQKALANAAGSLGLGIDHALGYPVFLGSVPNTAGSKTEHAADLIGQGTILASPIAMATVAASVASGHTVVPLLVAKPGTGDTKANPPVPLTRSEAARLRTLMRGVVVNGTAHFLINMPAPPVLAKTGTAEFGSANPPQTHAWMIAIHGDLAVAAFVDVGQSGSGTAGPILESFLRAAH